jgi:YD repeat-containing protein
MQHHKLYQKRVVQKIYPDGSYETREFDATGRLTAIVSPAGNRTLLNYDADDSLLPREFPSWNTVYHYFRSWKNDGVWTCLQRSMYQQVRRQAGRAICPSVVIMDGQSVKTTERGGIRGFDAHKRVKGRKRHIVVDIFGLLIACRVEPADISDRKAAVLLLENCPNKISRSVIQR